MPVHVVYVADAPRIGGAERYLTDVVAGAVAAGHTATVLAPQDALLDAVRAAAPGGGRAFRGRRVRRGCGRWASGCGRSHPAAARMSRAVRKAKPDLVHINNGGYPGSDLCRFVQVFARQRPAVMSVHSVPWAREHSDPRVQRAVDAALWRSLDAVTGATKVVGDGLADPARHAAPSTGLLPIGIPEPDGADRAAQLRARLAPGGELLVGMVSATADPGKGHTVLRDALGLAGDSVQAVMVGADPGDGFDGVTVTGRVASVGPYLHAIDVLVVPSTAWESLPLVILEAMAAGKPVFGSRLAGIPEAIVDGETGVLFEPGDAAALARLLAGADREGPRAHGRGGTHDLGTALLAGANGRRRARALSGTRLGSAMSKILVTGATGFLGRHVMARAAERGHEPVASEGDLRDADAARTVIERIRPDALVHLASGPRTADAVADAVAMARNVLVAAGAATVLIPGSAAQYGIGVAGAALRDALH